MESRDPYIRTWQDLSRSKRLVLMAGPRQAGKTTLAKSIARSFTNSLYFNWDIPGHRTRLLENPAFFEDIERKDSSTPLVILDEIHKYRDWKNYLKGIYDEFHDRYQFLVSGSGRLDIYKKGGDSLAGRYFLFYLWPLTIAELAGRNRSIEEFHDDPLSVVMERNEELAGTWARLSTRSGFPEPFLAGRVSTYRRWSSIYAQQLIREDVRDLAGIRNVEDMESLYYLLPSRVGSSLSVPSLARDLKVSYNSVRNWLSVFERFFMTFSISPWTPRIARAIQKERKVYLWDVPRIKEPAARFENMVAVELLRAVTSWNDLGHGTFSLNFIKNKEQQEVDFLIANEQEPVLLIEAKYSDTVPSPALRKFQTSLDVPAVQLTMGGDRYRLLSNAGRSILVVAASQWLSQLP